MKKKSTSQSAYLNVRVLFGLFIFLAFLLGLGVFFNASAQVNSDTKFAQWNPLVWMEQKVTASDGTTNSYFGSAAALNGSTALIGADGDNSFQGAAYLFTKSNGSWNEGQKLTASDGLPGDEFGYRVALADHTLLVGAFTATVGGVVSQGAAYLFTQSNGTWSESQKLTANDGALFDNFGASVALDGSTLVVGANGATVGGNAAQGAVYVFTESNGAWTQTQKLTADDGAAFDNFGLSVALKGSTILVGSPAAPIGTNAGQGRSMCSPSRMATGPRRRSSPPATAQRMKASASRLPSRGAPLSSARTMRLSTAIPGRVRPTSLLNRTAIGVRDKS